MPRKSVQWNCSVRSDELTDRQTDMTELTAAFRNFTNAPKNEARMSATLCPLALL